MRHKAVVFVGAGAGGAQRVLRPIVIYFLGPARADHQDVAERVRNSDSTKLFSNATVSSSIW